MATKPSGMDIHISCRCHPDLLAGIILRASSIRFNQDSEIGPSWWDTGLAAQPIPLFPQPVMVLESPEVCPPSHYLDHWYHITFAILVFLLLPRSNLTQTGSGGRNSREFNFVDSNVTFEVTLDNRTTMWYIEPALNKAS
jgi:hypothetical protein